MHCAGVHIGEFQLFWFRVFNYNSWDNLEDPKKKEEKVGVVQFSLRREVTDENDRSIANVELTIDVKMTLNYQNVIWTKTSSQHIFTLWYEI